MLRQAHNLSHTRTMTARMGYCYPTVPLEIFPGDSFRLQISNLTRFLPQVSPTMHEVNVGIDTHQVPLRQLLEKIGISWDDFLTGGEDGMTNIELPTITIPATGYEPGSLADFLGLPTNYINPDTGTKIIVGAGLEVNALPVIAYMHVINENYRDQNFIKKLDLTKYQEFLDGTYQFKDASNNNITYDVQFMGLFPKAWSRDYFGRALPNTQRGPQAMLPIGGPIDIDPTIAPIISTGIVGKLDAELHITNTLSGNVLWETTLPAGTVLANGLTGYIVEVPTPTAGALEVRWRINAFTATTASFTLETRIYSTSWSAWSTASTVGGNVIVPGATFNRSVTQYSATGAVDLTALESTMPAASIIAFRLASRMQVFGEVLQKAGARAVEFTLAMFGVRIPDDRIQRPIFHGSFRLPVVFSEVLQTSQTTEESPQGNLSGHGITGGTNSPLHIKVIEHGFLIHIMHIMPRSQFQNILPKMYLRKNRFDIPNPIFQHVGEQAIDRVEIYPNTTHKGEAFGYVPRYSELMHVPSTLHGHMKDTFLHWTMARLYNNGEPVLSARWRYENPSQRSFAVQDEDQMTITLGFDLKGRRPFARNPQPGIHIV